MAQELGDQVTARRGLAIASLAACLGGPVCAWAQDGPRLAMTTTLELSSDTDGFRVTRARAGGLVRYENPWSNAGVVLQMSRYSQGSFGMNVRGVLGTYRDQRRDTLAGIEVEAGVARVSGRTRAIGDATWRLPATPSTDFDLMASADLVDAPKALERGIGHSFFAAGVEQRVGERLTVTGLAGWQRFTDGNTRPHLRARLIWLAIPDHGVTLQLRYRQFDTRQADVDGAYFNPDDYRQLLGVVAVRKRYPGWIMTAAVGAGQERSASFDSRATYLAELRAEANLSREARLVFRGGYYRGAGYIDSPGYAYRSAGVTLVVPF